ncbi:transporter, major facilitator family protein [Aerococcus sp. Group 1]|nr:transporter, major facilitator family protein [Aerococcus sp. Group 1]
MEKIEKGCELMKTDTEQQGLPWLPLMVMLGLVLLAIISELLPSGLLVQMGDDLGVDYGTVSYLVGGYALPAGLLAIPMTQVVTKFNRRPLLLVLTCGFALSNFLVFLAPNFPLAFMGRLIGGASAGTFWSMLGPYAMDMVSSENRGKAGTIALAGSPIGISLGLPLWTRLGQIAGWRIAFLATALAFLVLGLLAWRLLPSIPGQASDSRVKPTDVLKKPGFRVAILVVFLMVMAEYSVYVYIQLISERLGLALQSSQIFFGVGALLAVWIVARFIDSHLKHLMQGALLAGALAMFVFLALSGHPLLGLGAMVLWGMSFGPISSLLQNSVIRQVDKGHDVAMSIQTTVFDLSIMGASVMGASFYQGLGLGANLLVAMILFLGAALVVTVFRQYYE